MIIIEVLIEAFIIPLFSICNDVGYLIYDKLIPSSKDKGSMSKALNIVLAIFGSFAIGIVILAIVMVIILYLI